MIRRDLGGPWRAVPAGSNNAVHRPESTCLSNGDYKLRCPSRTFQLRFQFQRSRRCINIQR
jgi:hypothetical protein